VLTQADDEVRRQVLGRRAQDLGFELGDDVADFILARQPRDLARLTALVEALDGYALAAKRRVTVALVREFLSASNV
jgi:DnaA family protein